MILLRLSDFINTKLSILKYKVLYGKRFVFDHLRIRGKFYVFLEPNASLIIGSAFFNRSCSFSAHKLIKIGQNCIFGENVKIYDHNHIFKDKDVAISEQGFSIDEVVIGNNCWIGSNVTILKGVHIGDNVIIGASCLIYKDIPDNSIVKMNSSLLIEPRE